jgi:hypothetical protein
MMTWRSGVCPLPIGSIRISVSLEPNWTTGWRMVVNCTADKVARGISSKPTKVISVETLRPAS